MGQGWRKVLSVLLTAAEMSGIFSANQDRGNTNPTVRLSPDDPFYQEFVAVWYAKESALSPKPNITPIYYSSFHFLFHYPRIPPILQK